MRLAQLNDLIYFRPMKTLTVITCFLFAGAEYSFSWETILSQINVAVYEEKWDQAAELFRQAIEKNATKAEVFYTTAIDKNKIIAPKMAGLLAEHYIGVRDYDKAASFYKELTGYRPDDITYRAKYAEAEMLRGNHSEALKVFADVLKKDPDNLSANIFMGNYYYLKAEEERMKVENNFRKITSPNRKQYTEYKEDLIKVFDIHHARAAKYLQEVIKSFPSVEAQKTLECIQQLEKEIKK